MSVVIDMSRHRAETQAAAWEAYRAAYDKAEKSGDIEDGRRAGLAWRRWLDLFMSHDQRDQIDSARLPSEIRR
jgi:hypothetical protein